MSIGKFAKNLILTTKLSNTEILEAVLKEFPTAKTSMACIAWYKSDLRKKGQLAKVGAAPILTDEQKLDLVMEKIKKLNEELEALEEEASILVESLTVSEEEMIPEGGEEISAEGEESEEELESSQEEEVA